MSLSERTRKAFNPDPARIQRQGSEVIYQIYPQSFNDSNNDGMGDLRGIEEKLSYIASMGVDAIWISPFFKSPEGPRGDGGYAVTDHRAIDPRFGSMDDFDAVLDTAHKLGLRVYIDYVLPHTADDHDWFKKSCAGDAAYDHFFVWNDGNIDDAGKRTPPNNWLSVFGGSAWSWNEERQQYYLHHFLDSQPALNLNRKDVQDAVIEEMKFWLDKGVDGLRLDSVPFANYDESLEHNPWRNGQWPFVDESWNNQHFKHSCCQEETVSFTERLGLLSSSYKGRDVRLLGEVICGPDGGDGSIALAPSYVSDTQAQRLDVCYTTAGMHINPSTPHDYLKDFFRYLAEKFPHSGHCISMSNHDIPRLASRDLDGVPEHFREDAVKQIMQIYASMPGGGLSFLQGTELGLANAHVPEDLMQDPVAQTKGVEHSRDGARTPMPWQAGQKHAGFSDADTPYLPVPEDHQNAAVDAQDHDPHSMLNFTRQLIAWRKAQPALVYDGQTKVLDTPDPILAFVRELDDGQALLCLHNRSPQPAHINLQDYMDEDVQRAIGHNKVHGITIAPFGSCYYGDVSVPQFKMAPGANPNAQLKASMG